MKGLVRKIIVSVLTLTVAVCAGTALSACSEKDEGKTDDDKNQFTEVVGSLYGSWNEYEGAKGFKVGFMDAEAYGNGEADERKILPELDCKLNEKYYMIADFEIRAPYDNDGRESVTAEVKVQPASLVTATVQETNSGNVIEETADGATSLRATYGVPESGGSVRNMRLVIQFTAKDSGPASVSLSFENPAGMQAVSAVAFEKTATMGYTELGYEKTVKDGTSVLGIADKTVKKVVIPAIYEGEFVTGIGSGAFADCTEMTEIYIPPRVKTIGDSAFGNCLGLAEIALPDNLVTIGKKAFSGCSILTGIAIPEGVTEIGGEAFEECNSLESVTVAENNAKYLGKDGILYDKPATKFVHIPQNLNGAAEIPYGVTYLDNYAFYGRSRLTGVTIPDSVTGIGTGVFRNCSAITEIRLPDGITRITDWLFSGCSKLTDLYIPDSVESIGWYAFTGCSALNYNEENGAKYLGSAGNKFAFLITAGYSVTECAVNENTKIIYDNAFANCTLLESVTLPEGLEVIGEGAFSGCAITEITVPDGVKEIGERAFRNCSKLTSITVPAVAKTGQYLLEYCSALKSITFKGTKAQWDEVMLNYIFNSQAKNYAVHCTDGDIER